MVTARGFGAARRRWPPRDRSQLRIDLAPPAIVSGVVTDLATGRLLPAAVTVMVRHPNDSVTHTVQAPRSAFEVKYLPPGPGLVTAHSPGFAPSLGSITVEAGKQRDARIGLLLEAQATGRVVDGAGDPVDGAVVTARYVGLAAGGLLGRFVGGRPWTGSDGVFALDGLVSDTRITLQAHQDGRRSAVETIVVAPGMRQLGIVLTLP